MLSELLDFESEISSSDCWLCELLQATAAAASTGTAGARLQAGIEGAIASAAPITVSAGVLPPAPPPPPPPPGAFFQHSTSRVVQWPDAFATLYECWRNMHYELALSSYTRIATIICSTISLLDLACFRTASVGLVSF